MKMNLAAKYSKEQIKILKKEVFKLSKNFSNDKSSESFKKIIYK